MQQSATLPAESRFSRFDGIVITTLLLLGLGTLLLIWRGNAVGLQVVSVSPARDATDVSTQTDIRIIFDRPLVATDVKTPLTFNPPVSGQTHWQGDTLIFLPDAPLLPNTTYTVEVQGEQRRILDETAGWQFTTRQPALIYIAPDEDGIDQLFVIDPASGDTRRLTQESIGVFDYQPAPDAALIAYSALREDGGSDLWVIAPDGSRRSQLLNCGGSACSGPSWAADSQRLVYERRTMLVPGAAPGPPRLWWLTLDGDTVPLFEDKQVLGYGAVWSPDGEWLGYVAPSSQGVQLYNVNDGRSLIIPSRMGSIGAWGPGSDVFLVPDVQPTEAGFAVHLLKASPQGGELVDLTGVGEPVEDSSPAWSPDGAWLAFTRKVAGAAMGKQVWLMRPDGSEARYLTNDTALHHGLPRWSPDGNLLAYQRFPLKESSGFYSIWLMDVATGETRRLVENGNRATWLP